MSALTKADLAEALALRELIRWAYDTLYEIDPSNYDHDEVCKLNDASVEVILGLAQALGEKCGKTAEWWAEYSKSHPVSALSMAPATAEGWRTMGEAPILAWVPEDELPESLPSSAYDALYPHSRVDGIRMFPVFGAAPTPATPDIADIIDENLKERK